MKKILPFTILILLIISCNKTGKQLKERIANADSAAINYFKGDGTMDTVVTVKIIRDKQTLNELTGLLTASTVNYASNCGADGSIHFFKKDRVVQDIDFRMNKEDCRQFSFLMNGKTVATALSAEAKKLLETIKK
jgi:hypothetical protein